MEDRKEIRAIAWDLDNTLFDRDAAVALFFTAWVGEHPLLSGEERQSALADILEFDNSGYEKRMALFEFALRRCGDTETAPETLWRILQARLPGLVTPDLVVYSMVERLAARYTMALVSNGSGSFQRAKLNRCGLEPLFRPDFVLVSEEIGSDKPDQRIFHLLLERLRLPAQEVLFVGDNPANDIAGAAPMGLQTCWIARGRPAPRDLQADFVVNSVLELEALIAPQAG